jgi:predicted ferric reductase
MGREVCHDDAASLREWTVTPGATSLRSRDGACARFGGDPKALARFEAVTGARSSRFLGASTNRFGGGRRRAMVGAFGAYVVVALVPLFVILTGELRPERGFWIEFGVALGFVGLVMMCLQSILTARYPRLSGRIGQDTLLQFHRQAGLVAFGFALAHPVVLLLAAGGYWEFLDPRVNVLRAVFLVFVLFALPVLILTSLWRESFHLPYQWWRLGHGALALVIVLIGLVHISQVRHYLADPWKQALWVAMGAVSIGSVLYVRAIKPLLVRRHPYRVAAVESTSTRTWLITLTPQSQPGLEFSAGQFAFVTFADSPYSLEQHPFSIASSAARRDHLEFAIKELGDFTSTIGDLAIDQRAFVDGPYGSMQLPERTAGSAGLMLVAGGIGITPAMSMLRTLADRVHPGPVIAIHADNRAEDVAYAEDIEALRAELDLTVVRVLAEPPPGWQGESGFVSAELIARHLPDRPEAWDYVLCGPGQMMETAERSLVDNGVPAGRIHSERFDIGAADAVGHRSVQVRRSVLGLGLLMLLGAALFTL